MTLYVLQQDKTVCGAYSTRQKAIAALGAKHPGAAIHVSPPQTPGSPEHVTVLGGPTRRTEYYLLTPVEADGAL